MSSDAPGGAAAKSLRGYIDGCFDLMHSGHFNAIRQARLICDELVVGVHSDEEIRLHKGPPVMRQQERYAMLTHLKWIDDVVEDVPYSPSLDTLDRARADFAVHGDDMPVTPEGKNAYDAIPGRLRIVRRTQGVSTTDLISRLMVRGGTSAVSSSCSTKVTASCSPSLEPEAKTEAETEGGDEVGDEADESFLRLSTPVQFLVSTTLLSEFSSSRNPKEDDVVVYVSGGFDLFHVGHAQFLKDAKALGTFLIVGIHDDATVQRSKGRGRPVLPMCERALCVCACKWVDEVLLGAPEDLTELTTRIWKVQAVAAGVRDEVSSRSAQAQAAGRDEVGGESEGEGSRQNPQASGEGAGGRRGAASRFATARRLGLLREIPSKWPELSHSSIALRVTRSWELYSHRTHERLKIQDEYYSQELPGV